MAQLAAGIKSLSKIKYHGANWGGCLQAETSFGRRQFQTALKDKLLLSRSNLYSRAMLEVSRNSVEYLDFCLSPYSRGTNTGVGSFFPAPALPDEDQSAHCICERNWARKLAQEQLRHGLAVQLVRLELYLYSILSLLLCPGNEYGIIKNKVPI